MRSLRSRLIAAFSWRRFCRLGATIWVTMSLLERSLGYATTEELDRLSRTLERTVRQFYQREREALRQATRRVAGAPVPYAGARPGVVARSRAGVLGERRI